MLSRLLDASTESHILMAEVLPAVLENNVEFIQVLILASKVPCYHYIMLTVHSFLCHI